MTTGTLVVANDAAAPTSTPARHSIATLDLREAMQLANQLANVPEFVPSSFRGRPEAVLAAILTGQELGLGPMESLRSVHVIEGRPSLSAEAMRALVLARGHEIELVVREPTRVVMRGRRRGYERWGIPVEWTMDRARRAGLAGRPNWQRYPEAMLVARATVQLCREMFADVTAGIDVLETAGDPDLDREQTPPPTTTLQRPATAPELPPPATDGGSVGDEASDDAEPAAAPEAAGSDQGDTIAPAPVEEEPVAAPTPPPPDTGDPVGVGEAPPDPEPSGDEQLDTARRRLHAQLAEAFPTADREALDRYRHALVAVATRTRRGPGDAPITSSADLTLAEHEQVIDRLNRIKAGEVMVGDLLDGGVGFVLGPYHFDVDPDGNVHAWRSDQ